MGRSLAPVQESWLTGGFTVKVVRRRKAVSKELKLDVFNIDRYRTKIYMSHSQSDWLSLKVHLK